jgi:hypothetical protein
MEVSLQQALGLVDYILYLRVHTPTESVVLADTTTVRGSVIVKV